MIGIIIPHFSKDVLTNKLIGSIQKHCSGHDIKILVVDDGSPKPFEGEGCTIARVDENMGFLYASKLGLFVSQGDIKILINNDVEVSGDFLPPVEAQIEKNKMSLVGNRLISYDTGWNTFSWKCFPYLEGYFLAASKEFWNEIDFDTRFAPCDMEDVDLSTQAYEKKYPVVSIDSKFLTHLGALSYGYNSKREAITRANKEKFREKWSTLINVEGKM